MVLLDDATDAAHTYPVSGVIRPYHQPGDYGNGGLVVLSAPDLAALGPTRPLTWTTYSADDTVGGVPHWLLVLRTTTDAVALSGAVWAVLLIGLALWCLSASLLARDLRNSLADERGILVELGLRPLVGDGYVLAVQIALSLVAAIGSVLVARSLILAWTRFYVTPEQAVGTAALMVLAAIALSLSPVPLPSRRAKKGH